MCAVDVGVGHDDDAVIAQLCNVEVVIARAAARLADAGSKCRDQREYFVAGQQLLIPRLLDIQNLPAQGKNRLKLAVASLLGRAARRVTLDDIDFAQRRVLFLAIGELAG